MQIWMFGGAGVAHVVDGSDLFRFRLADIAVLFTSGERRRAKGEKASPLAIPGPWRMPTVGKAPGCGMSFTGREPHAIPGVTLPFAVILTAHRLQPSRRPARQTVADFSEHAIRLASYEAIVGASEARDALVLRYGHREIVDPSRSP